MLNRKLYAIPLHILLPNVMLYCKISYLNLEGTHKGALSPTFCFSQYYLKLNHMTKNVVQFQTTFRFFLLEIQGYPVHVLSLHLDAKNISIYIPK